MNVLFLNLPNKKRVIRRYMCSYNSHSFLYPPIELLSLAGIVTKTKKGSPFLIDAIAENIDTEQVIAKVKKIEPDIIVSLTGLEIFEDDVDAINAIKSSFPQITYIIFGHYPTTFPNKTLEVCKSDYIMLGESDFTFLDLYLALINKSDKHSIDDIAYLNNGITIINKSNKRIRDINELPLPAYHLLNISKYSEPFMPRPFTIFQSARGCPYTCNYCIKSYGTKLTTINAENLIKHIDFMVHHHGIKSFRFIDDTFTAIPKRVIEICELLISKNYNLKWSCLSRADTLNKEMLLAMKKAGCIRLFIGIESGSERVLAFHKKKMKIELIKENLKLAKEIGINITGLFMVGSPIEEEEDFLASVQLALDLPIDMIAVSGIATYPGTEFYNTFKDDIDFSLYPYNNTLKDKKREIIKQDRAVRFYKAFYKSPKKIVPFLFKSMVKEPISTAQNSISMLSHLYVNKKNDRKRMDYF